MSVEAITWALRQPIPQSSAKFVLVVLANCASGDTWLAYPSTQYVCDATGQDRKTVLANMAKLREWGLIEDTEKRAGLTKQIVVYRVMCSTDLFTQQSQKRDSTENGTVPKTTGNSPVFPRKQSQKRDTEPSGTVKNQELKAGATSADRGRRLPDGWMPTAAGMEFAIKRVGEAAADEIASFKDHWKAAPSSRGVKADWDAAFRNWIRKAKPRNNHAAPVRLSAAERVLAHAVAGELADAERADPGAHGRPYLVGANG